MFKGGIQKWHTFLLLGVVPTNIVMDAIKQKAGIQQNEVREDFSWGATIGVLVLMLAFIGATFYVLISSLNDLNS